MAESNLPLILRLLIMVAFFILIRANDYQNELESSRSDRAGWKFKEKAHVTGRPDIIPGIRANAQDLHTVVFAVKQRNLDILSDILHNVSDPSSEDYGKHWSKESIAHLTANLPASREITSFLEFHGVNIVRHTLNHEYITAEGQISVWEELFATKFFEFRHKHWNYSKIIRAMEYSLPTELDKLVNYVFYLTDFPVPINGRPILKPAVADNSNSFKGYMSPTLLQEIYGIDKNISSKAVSSQAFFSMAGNSFQASDLVFFQNIFKLPQQALMQVDDVLANEDIKEDSNLDTEDINCEKANDLDYQYLISMAPNMPTMFYSFSDDWLSWIITVANIANPPNVLSVTLGSNELYMSSSYIHVFNTEVMKLGVMGVTILVSSGNDGAAGYDTKIGDLSCGYFPIFPATSPFVTSIGATQGPESEEKEISCQSNRGGVITSGGGFSEKVMIPSFQYNAVSEYVKITQKKSKQPISGYNSTGRAYPDISAVGFNYIVVCGKQLYALSGTSAATHVSAAMISLANTARKNVGKTSMGWLNPFLYANAAKFVKDIVQGNNLCTSDPSRCCNQGFYAEKGWDPMTGLGVLNYKSFEAATLFDDTESKLKKMQSRKEESISIVNTAISASSISTNARFTDVPSTKPSEFSTKVPTMNPSSMTKSPINSKFTQIPTLKFPTLFPTMQASEIPSLTPTFFPSIVPSIFITKLPTLSPTNLTKSPSAKPSRKPSHRPKLSSITPTNAPIACIVPTLLPTGHTCPIPSQKPSLQPTSLPSPKPTYAPIACILPSLSPTTNAPSCPVPSQKQSIQPSTIPSHKMTKAPTKIPTRVPSNSLSKKPTRIPSKISTRLPSKSFSPSLTRSPTKIPTRMPSKSFSIKPTRIPAKIPTRLPSSFQKPTKKTKQ